MNNDLASESISFQWDFYERALNNYSIIMRIVSCFEEEGSLIRTIPKVFVEESPFDMCKIFIEDNEVTREGFFSLGIPCDDIDIAAVRELTGGASSPSLTRDALGYRVLYVHPLKKGLDVVGFLILGKQCGADLDELLLRELEIVCTIYNKCLLLGQKDESIDLYESALNDFPDAVLILDTNGSVSYANKRAKREFESSKGLLIGEKVDTLVTGIEFNRKSVRGEVNYTSQEQHKAFTMESYPVKGASWNGIILKDVLELKAREEERLLKGIMENMGTLAGSIGHDFNNLLTSVLGYSSMIKSSLKSNKKLYRFAEAIEDSAQKAAELTRHLLNFSRRQRKTPGIVDLNAILDDILFLLGQGFKDMEVEKTFDDLLPPVRGDEADLQNVFLNLCLHAKDAVQGHGLLRVTTKKSGHIGGRQFASVEIEDTGPGMSDETRQQIFKPSFTSGKAGSDLGMEFYLIEKVVKEHDGFIDCESAMGTGTKFTIYIPLPFGVVGKQVSYREPDTSVSILKRNVLVVDDENFVRDLIEGILSREGIEVLKAGNGREAKDVFTEHHDHIDLVILDMIMPGIKGDEVLKMLREIRDDIKVIISSGFMSEDQRERLRECRVEGFLDKPYKDRNVIRIVNRILSN